MQRGCDGGSVSFEDLVILDSCEHHSDAHVERGANEQGGHDPQGQIPLGVFALLRRSGHGIKTDVAEKNDGAASQHALEAVGHKGMPVDRLDVLRGENNENKDGDQLDPHHDRVRFR